MKPKICICGHNWYHHFPDNYECMDTWCWCSEFHLDTGTDEKSEKKVNIEK